MMLDLQKIRADFPILSTRVNGKPLVYFDNGATTQKPIQVIQRITDYYEYENSNVHRGVHRLSQVATDKYESARNFVANFINAESRDEIIFTRGTTESINLMASILEGLISPGDEIMVSIMEHHSNLVPWQQLCSRKKATLRIIPVNEAGEIEIESFKKMMNSRVKILAFTHISNVLGTINPVKEMTEIAHMYDVPVLIDGAQAIAHTKVDVQDIDCEFYAFSAHKAYGPMGTGVLFGKRKWMEKLPPYQFGGEMIDQVGLQTSTFNDLPYKFEAGTPNVAGVLGMETALDYIEERGIEHIKKHEDHLLQYATQLLQKVDGIKILGDAKEKTTVLSFTIEGIHPYDIGSILDQLGIAIRTGNHCAQPLVDSFGLPGTIRASFAMYNSLEEVDVFLAALQKALKMLR